ncbi:MAG: 23S rRNA (adenine(2503)-C(2))-methyltransferase RlmN [Mariprofundaceae bacterium]
MNPNALTRPELPLLDAATLAGIVAEAGYPAFRARQILNWRNKGVLDPEAMHNLPKDLRAWLAGHLACAPLEAVSRQVSRDGTRKYAFRLLRGRLAGKVVETVFIPDASRGTVCVSSQAGCVLDCPFCHTGTQGFAGNLSGGEIVAQILAVMRDLRADPPPAGIHDAVSHVVYMGMGEPLANEPGVHASLGVLLAEDGLRLSRRRVTVSTSGLLPQIERLGAAFPVNLAISLHAARDELRDELVPINRKYPLSMLRACLDDYPLGRQRHITLEYVMLDGVNDTDADVAALARFARPHRERVNLIRFNPWPGSPYRGTPMERMNAFAQTLIEQGIRATVRRSRGDDIMAACGQLKASLNPRGEEQAA